MMPMLLQLAKLCPGLVLRLPVGEGEKMVLPLVGKWSGRGGEWGKLLSSFLDVLSLKNLLEPVRQRRLRETAQGAAWFGSCQQEGKNRQVRSVLHEGKEEWPSRAPP